MAVPHNPIGWDDHRIEQRPTFLTQPQTLAAQAHSGQYPIQKRDQMWYVKLPGDQYKISEVVITDITQKTVCFDGWSTRYAIDDIQFIELVKDA